VFNLSATKKNSKKNSMESISDTLEQEKERLSGIEEKKVYGIIIFR
jgi:hypothetical protein